MIAGESTQALVARLISLFRKAESHRSNWTTYWQELAKYVQPMKNDPYGYRAKGEKRGDELLDSTAIHSNELLGSALHTMLTNPTTPWIGITTGIEELDNNDDARNWMGDAVRVMHNVLNNSNFQTEIHELYLDEGSFGTGAMMVEEDDVDVVRFQARSIFEVFALENSKGVIDTLFRRFKMNYSQLVDAFGKDWCDENTHNELKQDPINKEFEIIHCILPREGGMDYNLAKTSKEYKIASFYVLMDKSILLKEDGYKETPFVVPRWTKIAGEVYGRSPAMKALPDIKMLNKMMETVIKSAQLQTAPPLAVPDDGYMLPVKMQPFGITYYRSGTQDEIKPLFQNIRLDLSRETVEATRMKIQQAFFIDQLQLRTGPQMTATEVNQRTEEQLRLLGPILGRQHNELLKPLINRVFAICQRKNLFKPVPAVLAKKKIDFIYASQIAKVQRTAEIANINKVIAAIAPVIQSQPNVMDYFDGDQMLKYSANAYMLPANLIRKDSEVKQMRQAAMQAQQQRAQEESQLKQSQMMKDMSGVMTAGE